MKINKEYLNLKTYLICFNVLFLTDETEWDNLHDNRDLDVLLSWEPKEK